VADFDLDGLADVLVVVNGEVHLVDNSGTVVWTQPLSGGGLGGPPTVADFDNDDFPDVGVAGYDTYSVFDGDHKNEVMYADEQTFRILDGATGAVEWQSPEHASGTLVEYPVLADVDGDALLDVVVASNDDYIQGAWSGVHVLTDPSWSVPGRPVWNQHAYSISNMNDDLSIPAVPLKNPLVWNTFRAGGLATGSAHGRGVDGAEQCDAGNDIGVALDWPSG